jgi:hypothetical protein
VGNNLVNFLYEGSLINVELPLDNSDDEVGKQYKFIILIPSLETH